MYRLRFEWFENNFVFLIYNFVPHITQNLADGSSFAPQFVQNLVVPLSSSSVGSPQDEQNFAAGENFASH